MISIAVKVKKRLGVYKRNNARIKQQDLLKRGCIHSIGLSSVAMEALIDHVQVPEFGLVEIVVVQHVGQAQNLR